jgi:hypothetical protein
MAATKKPVTRTLNWTAEGGYYAGKLVIKQGKETDAYLVREIGADFGRGFQVEHLTEGQCYHVNVTDPAAHSTCECLGFLRWSRCKHRDSLAALIKLGML